MKTPKIHMHINVKGDAETPKVAMHVNVQTAPKSKGDAQRDVKTPPKLAVETEKKKRKKKKKTQTSRSLDHRATVARCAPSSTSARRCDATTVR